MNKLIEDYFHVAKQGFLIVKFAFLSLIMVTMSFPFFVIAVVLYPLELLMRKYGK